MTKKERVVSALKGENSGGVPSGFSIHFPRETAFGEPGVKAHLDFFRATDTDILKIMNENFVPYMGDINSSEDWCKIPIFTGRERFISDQIDFVKRILDRCETDTFTMGTLHGITASVTHPLKKQFHYDYHGPRQYLCRHLRENRDAVLESMKRISDVLCILAEKYIEAGLDSVYYASLGGEYRYFTDEEFESCIAPFDKQILGVIKEAGGYAFLHICKDGVNIERYRSYRQYADAVNWGVYEVPCSLGEGSLLFDGLTVMGGLANRDGVLENGSSEDIERAVRDIMKQVDRSRFILGADCTLPTDISCERIRTAVEAARSVSQ